MLAVAAALVTFAITELARWSARVVARQPWLLLPAAALVVAGLAIGFAQITDQSADVVLFSGEDAFGSLIEQGPTLSLSTLAFLIVFKGLAWSISLGNFRGGPTFPALVHRRGRGAARRAPAGVLRDARGGRADGRRRPCPSSNSRCRQPSSRFC